MKSKLLLFTLILGIKKRYFIEDHTIELLLQLFEKVDKSGNGVLTFSELQPVMNVVAMSESNQFEFFMRVDTDGSGLIDFGEFCEMIILIGKCDLDRTM